MEDIIILIVLGGFVAVALISVIVQIVKSFIINAKKLTVQAQVSEKKIKRSYSLDAAKAGITGADWLEYYGVFRTEKGKKLELQMSKEIYDSIKEGDKGQLTYKGCYIISFDKNSCYFV